MKRYCLYHSTPSKADCIRCELYVPEYIDEYETMPGEWEEEIIEADCMASEIIDIPTVDEI